MKPSLTMQTVSSAHDQGFTLIETIIGLLIFTIGILAVCSMTSTAIKGYVFARTNTTQVNRTTANTEALKHAGYENSNVFSTDGTQTSVQGSDGTVISYGDNDDVVVAGTKLIVMENSKIKGASGEYTLYYTKPLIR